MMILVSDAWGLPSWIPLELFEVTDARVGDGWLFDHLSTPGVLRALWGYPSLIQDDEHYDGLVERDPAALRVFYDERRRLEDLG